MIWLVGWMLLTPRHLHGAAEALLILLVSSALLDICLSLWPRKLGASLDGQIVYNDGGTIRMLLRSLRPYRQYKQATLLLEQKDYPAAATLFARLLKKNTREIVSLNDAGFLRNAMWAMIMAKRNDEALVVFQRLNSQFGVNASDYNGIGFAHSIGNKWETARHYFNRALELEPGHLDTHCNMGFMRCMTGEYAAAITDFNQVIAANHEPAYAYSNRGWARVKLGQADAGLEDIRRGLALDPEEGYGYRAMGMYLLETGQPAEALHWFRQARDKNPDVYDIDALILQAQTV